MIQNNPLQEKGAIAERIYSIRKYNGLTRDDFAKRVDVSAPALKNYELAHRDPPLNMILRISREFGVDLNWIATGEGSATLSDQKNNIFQIIDAIRKFELSQNTTLAIEKEAKVFTYLFQQLSNGQNLTDQQIQEFLETAATWGQKMKFENKKNEQIENIWNKQTLFLQRARNQAIVQLLLFWQIGTIAVFVFTFRRKWISKCST